MAPAMPHRPAACPCHSPAALPPTAPMAASTKAAETEPASTTAKLKLTINARTGLLSGTFLPQTPKLPTTSLSGILYQKINLGIGQFLGPSQSGSVLVTPQ